jgi:GT2 family glycosyltransferase
MHRSGTSALMRVLNLLGIDIGCQLLPTHSTNETGFWELMPVVCDNDDILKTIHSSWFNPRPLPEQWWQIESLAPFRQQLSEILQQNFASSTLWGIKDPRLCRLLPLWLPILAEFGSTPHFIIIARHPDEVAASLKRRDELLQEHSLWLWLTYMLEAELATQNYPRVFITYDELLADWQATVTKIAATLQLQWPNQIASQAPQINEFLKLSLKHHQVSPEEVKRDDELSRWSQTVYQAMSDATHGQEESLKSLDAIRRALLGYAKRPNRVQLTDSSYQAWRQKHKVSLPQSKEAPAPNFLFSIGLPEQSEDLLTTTLNSLHAQVYQNWQWTDAVSQPLESGIYSVLWLRRNKFRTPTASDVESDWIAFLPTGDTVAPELLWWCARYIAIRPHWRFIYTDEDSCSPQEEYYAPQFKPDFNLDLLRSMPYIGGLVLVQREALQAVGGYVVSPTWRNYDLALKILDHYGEAALGHIPHLLYHRSSVNYPPDGPATTDEGIEILQQHLQRNAIYAQVYETDFPNLYCIEYPLETTPLVSIILATRNTVSSLQRCLQSLLKVTSYPYYEVILVDNQSTAEEMRAYLEQLKRDKEIRVLRLEREENLATINNFAVPQAKGSLLLFLNDDTEIIQPDWLQELLGHILRSDVGMVGPRLLGADHRLLQSGLILGMGTVGIAGQINQGLWHDEWGYLGRNQATQNCSALSEACLMITKSLYLTVGGMDETMRLFNEVDFCLKVREPGYKLVWTPFATLLQHGPGSLLQSRQQPVDHQQLDTETTLMYERWLPQLSHDPAYHPHLCLNGPDWQPDIQFKVPWDVNFHDRPRVVAFPYDSWGCGEYRVRAPLRALQQAGWLEYALLPEDREEKVPTLTELARMQPDTVLLHNTLHNHQLQALAQYQRFHSSFKVFGQDDLLYALPKSNPYRRLNYKDIKNRILKAISHCDRLLVTTEPLAEVYQYVVDEIRIVPNYLERSRWANLSSQRRQGRKPRVGWAGAGQHQGDLQLIIPLVKTLAEKEEVEWIFLGMYPDELRPYITEYHPMESFDQYSAKLASLNLDLAIAPLEHHPFNAAKSNLRILEYGILGWPVVCSDIYPYQKAPVTRVANTPQAWLTAVEEYIHDLEAAARAGESLKQWVLANWMLEDHLQEWGEALNIASPTGVQIFRFGPSKSEDLDSRVFILGCDVISTSRLENLLCTYPTIAKIADDVVGFLNLGGLGNLEEQCLADDVIGFLNLEGLGNLAEEQFLEEPLRRLNRAEIPHLWTEQETLFRYSANDKHHHQADLLKKRWKRLLDKVVIQNSAVNLARTLWLQQQFPNAYFIHIVRNGYAVALELRETIQNCYGPQPLLLSRVARHWARSLEILLADVLRLDRFLEVRYETLTTDPQTVARQVFDFLNLSQPNNQELTVITYQDSGILAQMTAEQRAVITHEAGQMLAHYGYEG